MVDPIHLIKSMQTHLIAQKISKLSSFYSLSTTLLCFSLSFQGFLLQRNIFWQFLANTLSPFFVLQSALKNAPTTKVKNPAHPAGAQKTRSPKNVKKPQTWCDCHWYGLFSLLKLILYNTKPQNQMCDWNKKKFCFFLQKS